jgi:hypothetical protein
MQRNRFGKGIGVLLCVLTGVSTPSPPAGAVKVTPAKKRKPTHVGKAVRNYIKDPQFPQPLFQPNPNLPFTGVILSMPADAAAYPSYLVSLPNGDDPPGVIKSSWSEFAPDEGNGDPKTATLVTAPSAAEKTKRISLSPGKYKVTFSMSPPTDAENLLDYSVPVVWSETARVKKNKGCVIHVRLPDLSPDKIAHVNLVPKGTTEPFNSFSLVSASSDRNAGDLISRWDFFAPATGWPESIPLSLLKGRYRLTLSATALGAFSSIRYELPEPLNVVSSGEISFSFPKFYRLSATFIDRKGQSLIGVPLMIHGEGETMAFADTGGGHVDILLPEGRYKIKALVLDKHGDQKEATLEDGLEIKGDLARTWKAPTTTIDFGFGRMTNK